MIRRFLVIAFIIITINSSNALEKKIKYDTTNKPCIDSKNLFQWTNQLAVSCEWVAENKERGSCEQDIAKNYCPHTCDECFEYPSSSSSMSRMMLEASSSIYQRPMYYSLSMSYSTGRQPSSTPTIQPTGGKCSNIHMSFVTTTFSSTMSLMMNLPSPISNDDVSIVALSSVLKVAIQSISLPGSTVDITNLGAISTDSITFNYTTSISATCSGNQQCTKEGDSLYLKAKDILSNAFISGDLVQQILKSFSTPMNVIIDPQSWVVHEPVKVIHTLPYPKYCLTAPQSIQPSVDPVTKTTSFPFTRHPTLYSYSYSNVPSTSVPPKTTVKPSLQPRVKSTSRSPLVTRLPVTEPSFISTLRPVATINPASKPSIYPIVKPSLKPSDKTTNYPTLEHQLNKSKEPTVKPTPQPIVIHTSRPSIPNSTSKVTVHPSSTATVHPTMESVPAPTTKPYGTPVVKPSGETTAGPSSRPNVEATWKPSFDPTIRSTGIPSMTPSYQPVPDVITKPSAEPMVQQTVSPSANPFAVLSAKPTAVSSAKPSIVTMTEPTVYPSLMTSSVVMARPTEWPSSKPFVVSTGKPTIETDLTASPTKISSTTSYPEPSTKPVPENRVSSTNKPWPSATPSSSPSITLTSNLSKKPVAKVTYHPTKTPSSGATSNPMTRLTSRPSIASIVTINYESTIQLSNISYPFPPGQMKKVVSVLKSSIESVSLSGSLITITKVGSVSVTARNLRRVLATNPTIVPQPISVVFNTSISISCSGYTACKESGENLISNSTSALSSALSSGTLVTKITSTATSEKVASLTGISIDPNTLVVSTPSQSIGVQTSISKVTSRSSKTSTRKENLYFLVLLGFLPAIIILAYRKRILYIETRNDVKIYHDLIDQVEAITVPSAPSLDLNSFASTDSNEPKFVLRNFRYFNPAEVEEIHKNQGTMTIKPTSQQISQFVDIDLNEAPSFFYLDPSFARTDNRPTIGDDDLPSPVRVYSAPRTHGHESLIGIQAGGLNPRPPLSSYPREYLGRPMVSTNNRHKALAQVSETNGLIEAFDHDIYDANNNADLLNDSYQVEATIFGMDDSNMCCSPIHERRYSFSDTILL